MKHMKRILMSLLIAVLLLSSCTALADLPSYCTVTATKLHLREEASASSASLESIRQGTTLQVLGKTGHWYKVSYNKLVGYVYQDYVEAIDDETLTKGSKGEVVKELQKRLKELGYYSSSFDGNYGTVTVNAVKAFQKKNGLDATGIADSKTQKKIFSDSAVSAKGGTVTTNKDDDNDADSVTLKKGSKGTAVKQLQQRLKQLGYYNSTCDGDYGSNTVSAVKAFQKKNGLNQTGIADEDTLDEIYSTSAIGAKDKAEEVDEDATLKRGSKGTAVKTLQKRLKELGYYNSTIDGQYGSGTVSAVKAFQKKNGLTQTGTADSATLKKVYADSAVSAADKTDSTTVTATLKRGSKGDAVKTLQKRLKELGYYNNVVDGQYGSGTVAAVKAFQKKHGLTQTGECDAATLKKINSTSAVKANDKTDSTTVTATLKRGSKGDAVKTLQKRLKELGYYNNVVDGQYGSGTVTAVKAFQKKNGLTQTGECDAATLKKINSTSAVKANDKTDDTKVETDGTLKRGSKGDAVKTLQKRLKELGYYNTVVDGQYGSGTVTAVKAFQKKNGLTQTGECDAATLKKINSSSAIKASDKTEETTTSSTLKKGAYGEEVKKVQNRLKELGYYTSVCDGNYGSKTVTAVKAFQKKNSLTQTGECDSKTLKKLNSDSALNAGGSASVTLQTSQTLKSGDSGSQVKALQTRLKELGYYTTTIDGDYGYRTSMAVSEFQRANDLTVTGTANSTTLKKLVSSKAVSKSEAAEKEEASKTYKTERLTWFNGGKSKFPNGSVFEVKDVKTGLVFKAQVLYGTNHLDAEPLTKNDTAILKRINGGEFSYERRAMLVKINGHVYAASIYSEPHGDENITDNNFDGQFCLHFYGSKTHGTNKVDADHQACVAQAMKATW